MDKRIILELDGEIIADNPESELIKMGAIDDSVSLELGDRFVLTDYPKPGDNNKVRVLGVQEQINENGERSQVKYKIGYYNEKE